jgi:cold shock CspA family protein
MPKIHQVALAAIILTAPGTALAQKPITKSNTVHATATVQAIDSTRRMVTLKTENGEEDTFVVSNDVKRFNELKVGDRLNVSYVESLVVTVRKPGAAPSPSTAEAAAVPTSGKMPGGTRSQQQTTTVTVKAIDEKVPSVTVLTADGRTVTRKIEDRKNLEGIKVGDKLDITYTEAVMVTAERAK